MAKDLSNINLFKDINKLISSSKSNIAGAFNRELVMLYWNVGNSIKLDVLNNKRAEYGKEIVGNLSKKLTVQHGKGWSVKQLQHCIRSAETFSENQIAYAVSIQLSWTHIRTLMFIEDTLKRDFYMQMCKIEHWSSRKLAERIDSMLFERTAISKKPDELIKQELAKLKDGDELTPDMVFRDPYILDFLGLKDTFSEKDLESAILVELQQFITEMGSDFAFLSRQKRITIDYTDYYIDLLFYHRSLQRLVVIELKLGKFKPEHKGQMELYLRWLDKYEKKGDEQSPIGLILCSEGNSEHVEFLMLDDSNIRVSQYLTQLPDKKLLEQRLHQAIIHAKQLKW